jgi:hypothetical protein
VNSLASKYINGPDTKKNPLLTSGSGDVFVASVINQKAVNQNAQQVLVLISAQILNITEAQFGFATNDDKDTINV